MQKYQDKIDSMNMQELTAYRQHLIDKRNSSHERFGNGTANKAVQATINGIIEAVDKKLKKF